LDIKGGPFGSELYSQEELRAEIASWMLCQDLGLDFKPENSASYVSFWLKSLKEDPYEIVRACRDAERIKKYVLGLELGQTQTVSTDAALASEAARATAGQSGNLATIKVYLDVPFREKDQAKELGATWDNGAKKWCARPGADLDKLAKWLPQAEAARAVPDRPEGYEPEISQEKVFLAVPFREKEQAKALGAGWDKETKLWFAPAGLDLAPLAKWIPEKEPGPAPALDPVDELARQLTSAGFKLDGPPVMNGRIQRVAVEGGKAGAKDGAYLAHPDGRPNGWIHNHKTGEHVKWVATGQVLTERERAALKARAAENLSGRQKKRERGYEEAAKRIALRFGEASTIPDDPEHPYLKAKGVGPFGIHQDRDGNLMVPGFDFVRNGPIRPEAEGQPIRIQTLQSISPDGKKHFEPGGKKAGAMHLVGFTSLFKEVPEILMAEGFATGASLHMATGRPVAVAFDAGNLKAAAVRLREKFPEARIIICADNDHKAKKNVGLEKALEAAQAARGQVAIPDFTDEEKKKGLTDFNDLHRERGLEAVAAVVGKALEPPAAQVENKGMER
jgi:phage/plasmid primase-like uncharacterized protein